MNRVDDDTEDARADRAETLGDLREALAVARAAHAVELAALRAALQRALDVERTLRRQLDAARTSNAALRRIAVWGSPPRPRSTERTNR